jgi:hypothetical protein
MSIATLSSEISRLTREVADLQKKRGELARKRSDILSKVERVQRTVASLRDFRKSAEQSRIAAGLHADLAKVDHSESDLLRKLADKEKSLSERRTKLAKEETDQTKRFHQENQREIDRQRRSADDLQRSILSRSVKRSTLLINSLNPKYDFFISHASEDKEEVARPLAEALRGHGCDVWFDELTLNVGDSLRRSIDLGISHSRFGVVILSETFFKKEWPQRELDGLTQQELSGESRILPLWHRVTASEVRRFSPSLADKVALNTATKTIEEIAMTLVALIGSPANGN